MLKSVGDAGARPGAAVRKPPLTVLIWLAVAFACAGRIG
jgi:hypothetical protein